MDAAVRHVANLSIGRSAKLGATTSSHVGAGAALPAAGEDALPFALSFYAATQSLQTALQAEAVAALAQLKEKGVTLAPPREVVPAEGGEDDKKKKKKDKGAPNVAPAMRPVVLKMLAFSCDADFSWGDEAAKISEAVQPFSAALLGLIDDALSSNQHRRKPKIPKAMAAAHVTLIRAGHAGHLARADGRA